LTPLDQAELCAQGMLYQNLRAIPVIGESRLMAPQLKLSLVEGTVLAGLEASAATFSISNPAPDDSSERLL